jgi:ribose transport system permease protein
MSASTISNVTEAPAVSRKASRIPTISAIVERFGLLGLLGVSIAVFALLPQSGQYFLSWANILQLLSNQSVTGLIAIAMVVPLAAGYFDLSVSAIAGIASVAFAHLVGPAGWPIALSIVATLAIALVAGSLNAWLVAVVRLNGFIVTLGTFTLFQGLLQWFTGGQTIFEGIPASVGEWGSKEIIRLPVPFWLLLVIAVFVWYGLTQIPAGRELESIGSNERAAQLIGIAVRKRVFRAFLASALLAGVAGILLTSRSGSADASAAPGYLFPALAAVFLGATCIRPGIYNVWGTVIGVFFVAISVNGLTLLGTDTWVTSTFNGAALIVAVSISTLMGRSILGASNTK